MGRWQRVIQCDNNKIDSVETMKFDSFGDELDIAEDYLSQDEPETPNVEEQAIIMIQQAQIEAENLISNAQSEADKIKKKAYESGYEEGKATAVNELKETTIKLTKVFNNAVNEIATIKDEIINNAEKDIIELTIAIAEKLVCNELKINPDLIIDVIKEAIRTARSENKVILRVNSNDCAILEKNADELIELTRLVNFNSNMGLIIESDENLNQGDCLVITDTNIFDMTYKSRLDSIIETINSYQSKVDI
jgi:flagellar assembly protein FliH